MIKPRPELAWEVFLAMLQGEYASGLAYSSFEDLVRASFKATDAFRDQLNREYEK